MYIQNEDLQGGHCLMISLFMLSTICHNLVLRLGHDIASYTGFQSFCISDFGGKYTNIRVALKY
jgi:hypothetical protein